MRMIFVNLPVKNIETSRSFFTALGFIFNPEYSDDRTLCMIVEENIFVMLLQEERFRDFINGDIADAKRSTEVLTCLTAGSREEIDRMIETALASAGSSWKPVQDHGFMYAGSFQDPDGHVWELVHMVQQA
ncbi:VOC family protein [Agrobacterium tumefaciens]|uniref:VOC family protein n=1 Tax=Agrobacterium tumefaciens TaxID=358 RepID=UPI001572485E|nr:VOC family protein [Agrobacterium tumefaciens]NTD84700.1 VOC family protein [Agrobacterium tumefaciens]NTD93638.1 VOC family protein [Agrobacterium tumefaciens]NTE04132.1 VOC family protein [Agrobacterium tumefaciens]NTE16347.1 VOC family protein [Agrobacterium tumefaciens]NTE21262.1 VOC family protein [Agrobacterium tumefaciens]